MERPVFRAILYRTFGDWGHGNDVAQGCSCPMAQKRYPLGVPAERRDVLPEPVKSCYQVHEPEVALRTASRSRLEKPYGKQATLVRQCGFESRSVSGSAPGLFRRCAVRVPAGIQTVVTDSSVVPLNFAKQMRR